MGLTLATFLAGLLGWRTRHRFSGPTYFTYRVWSLRSARRFFRSKWKRAMEKHLRHGNKTLFRP